MIPRPCKPIVKLLLLALLVASCDSTGSEIDPVPGPTDPVRDPNQIYWVDFEAGKIQRANLDGSDVEDLVSGLDGPHYIVFDKDSSKMYWTEGRFGDLFGKIQRANLDGSNVEDLVTGSVGYNGLALDVVGGKMYWTWTGTDLLAGRIQRANLDGSNVENLVTEQKIGSEVIGLIWPGGIALDTTMGKMYWVQTGQVLRNNFDGSDMEGAARQGESPRPSRGQPRRALDL